MKLSPHHNVESFSEALPLFCNTGYTQSPSTIALHHTTSRVLSAVGDIRPLLLKESRRWELTYFKPISGWWLLPPLVKLIAFPKLLLEILCILLLYKRSTLEEGYSKAHSGATNSSERYKVPLKTLCSLSSQELFGAFLKNLGPTKNSWILVQPSL